jgi:hypothetical protein
MILKKLIQRQDFNDKKGKIAKSNCGDFLP